MPLIKLSGHHSIFDRFATLVTRLTGSPWAFSLAVLSVLVWAASGPLFGFSETWQLVINTGTTIITFLMVFLIQQSQNKDSLAIHVKLNELIAAHEWASNRVVAVEDLDENDLATLRSFYCHLAKLAEKEGGIKHTHSLDEAGSVHARKKRVAKSRTDPASAPRDQAKPSRKFRAKAARQRPSKREDA